jgi:hypothetical protein
MGDRRLAGRLADPFQPSANIVALQSASAPMSSGRVGDIASSRAWPSLTTSRPEGPVQPRPAHRRFKRKPRRRIAGDGARRRSASNREAETRPQDRGGTGLEPVTPGLSRRPPRSRLLAAAAELLLPCRDFTLHKHAAFVPVCALSRELVVARGSTISAGSPANREQR